MRLIQNVEVSLTKVRVKTITEDNVRLLQMPQNPPIIESTAKTIPATMKKNIPRLLALVELALIPSGQSRLARVTLAGSWSAIIWDGSK
jgi:hypothetical protein